MFRHTIISQGLMAMIRREIDVTTEIAGPQLISLLCVVLTQGILTVQVWLYYLAFPNDRLYLKSLVYSVYLIETVQTTIVVDQCYDTFVRKYLEVPQSSALDRVGLIWIWYYTGGIVTLAVQGLYAYRIYVFGKSLSVFPFVGTSLLLAVIIAVLSVVQFGSALVLGLEVHKMDRYSQPLTRSVRIVTQIWSGGGVICDIIIAVAMTYLLYRSKEIGMNNTRRIVRKLIRLTIETGICTIVMAMIDIIVVNLPRKPTKFYEVLLPTVATGILSKIYANTMLVLLNSRAEFVSETLVESWALGGEPNFEREESERTDSEARLRFENDSNF